jgi:hypothetical protein
VARRIVGRPNQFRFSSFSLSGALCKLTNLPFPNSKNYQTFWGGKKNKMEQLYFGAQLQIPNGF